jgi:polyhydroxyalkanoate synthesis repressor PhaR
MAISQIKLARKTPAKKASAGAKTSANKKNMAQADGDKAQFEGHRLIKKYPNRRLYDTKHSIYITLLDIKGLVMSQEPFVVVDAKTGEEITRLILMQIILEEESGGRPLFSTPILMQMIRFYGNSLQGMISPVLEQNFNQLIELQNQYVAHCQKIGSLSSAESWLSFVNQRSANEVMNPLQFFNNASTQFLESLQLNPAQMMSAFPFKPFKS